MVTRFPQNPLVTPGDVSPSHPDLEVLCAFNPAATLFGDKRLLFLRIAEQVRKEAGWIATPLVDPQSGELQIRRFRANDPDLRVIDPRVFTYKGQIYLTSLSHFRAALSQDGCTFHVDRSPRLFPSGPYETYGIEDARITPLDGVYYINYTAVSERGVVTALARTSDFQTFERLGIIFGPDNKDVALFPEKIDGRYYTFHRPAVVHTGQPSIWLASSENLLDWGRHQWVAGPRADHWDCERVGGGASPILTPEGWLMPYHASDHQTRYCLGALLLDRDEPWKLIARSHEPFLIPDAPYERHGFMPEVVFHNGTLTFPDGTAELYYGGADLVTCGARVSIADLLAHLKQA